MLNQEKTCEVTINMERTLNILESENGKELQNIS